MEGRIKNQLLIIIYLYLLEIAIIAKETTIEGDDVFDSFEMPKNCLRFEFLQLSNKKINTGKKI